MSQPSEPTPPPRERGRRIHRRETLRQLVLPMLGSGLIILVIALVLVLLPARVQVSVLADWMFTILVLCPLVLCNLIVFLLVVVLWYGMTRLHRGTEAPLERLENLVTGVANRIERTSAALNQRVVNVSSRLAPLMKLFSVFDTPEPPDSSKNGKP